MNPLAIFAVPPHYLGETKEPRSRWERGVRDLAYAEHFASHFGLPITEVATDEAMEVYQYRTLRALGITHDEAVAA